jgi:FAD/FMN-containing dehydrogenase
MALTTSPQSSSTLLPCPAFISGAPGYDEARGAWNAAVDQRPAMVCYPADAAEVTAVMRLARDAGLRVVPQATGHNASPLGSLADCILLKTSALTGVTVDPVRRTARVGAGVLWDDVVTAAAPHGLTALHGSSPDVGVVGYSLGGGISWLGRLYGLQSSSVTAVELVLPDGGHVRCDADHDPELFWALRGGGGSFGVVTALEFELYPITTVYGGAMVWDIKEAARVVPAWLRWTQDAPDAVTTSLRLLAMPDFPEVPAPIRGRRILMIDGAVVADEPEARELLRPLRVAGPEIDMFGPMPAPALVRMHGDPEEPMPGASDTALLGPLDADGAAAFVEAGTPTEGGPLMFAELRQLGGALGRPSPYGGALTHLDGDFCAFAFGLDAGPHAGAPVEEATAAVIEALAPWHSGKRYMNFAERSGDASGIFADDTHARLVALRDRVDPDGLILPNHAL